MFFKEVLSTVDHSLLLFAPPMGGAWDIDTHLFRIAASSSVISPPRLIIRRCCEPNTLKISFFFLAIVAQLTKDDTTVIDATKCKHH